MFSRRSLLRASSAACFAATLPVRLLAQVIADRKDSLFTPQNLFSYTHGQMTQAAFERQIGTAFHVALPDGSYSKIVLTDVTPLSSQSQSAAKTTSTRVQSAVTSVASQFAAPDISTVSQVQPTVGPALVKRQKAALASGFSASFTVKGKLFPQDSYTVESATNGPAVIFLVPSPSSASTCTAIFS